MIENVKELDDIELGCKRAEVLSISAIRELVATIRALREVAKAAQEYLGIRNISTDETVRVDGRRAIEKRLMELPPELLR